MTAATACHTCGTAPREGARFCDGCGAPVRERDSRAELKQVTVLGGNVADSVELAAAVGVERFHEIMTELVDRCTIAVQRYGGMVDKVTDEGIIAVFGAPAALEDHALRACLSALGIQQEARAWPARSNATRAGTCDCASASIRGASSPVGSVRALVWSVSRPGAAHGVGGCTRRGHAQRVVRAAGRKHRGAG